VKDCPKCGCAEMTVESSRDMRVSRITCDDCEYTIHGTSKLYVGCAECGCGKILPACPVCGKALLDDSRIAGTKCVGCGKETPYREG